MIQKKKTKQNNTQFDTPLQVDQKPSFKDGGYFEFLEQPSDEDIYKFVPLIPDGDSAKKKIQAFVYLHGADTSVASTNRKLNSFFKQRKGAGNIFSFFYRIPLFLINKILDKGYLLIKKILFFEKKKSSDEENFEKESREIKIAKKEFLKNADTYDEAVKPDSLKGGLTKNVKKFKKEKRQKIQFRTLLLLSSRMFTTGSTRTILTILGISISIGVILFLISFGYGLQKTVLGRITTEDSLKSLVVTLPENNLIKKEAIDKIKGISQVEIVSPLVKYSGNIEIESIVIDSVVNIVDENYFSLAGLMSADGQSIKPEASTVVVSTAVSILLGFNEENSIIGSKLYLTPEYLSGASAGFLDVENIKDLAENKKEFTVKNVIEDELVAFAYVLNDDYIDLFDQSYIEAKVKVKTQDDLVVVKEQLFVDGYIISSISDTVEETRKIFRWIQLVLGFFGLVALIISAVGMLNILTIVLLERTQEIGIMKAIGASNNDVWKMVIFDAIIIGFLGGVGGSLIGLSASKFFNFVFSLLAQKIGGQAVQIFQAPPGFVASIILFSAVIGFLTGVWPAIRASRISPLEAIRYK